MRTLQDHTLIVFLSDTHIGGDEGHDIFESPEELTALLEELSAHGAPVELVLAGDFFDFLEIGEVPNAENRASVTMSRPEYRKLISALRTFTAGEGHRVIYLPGNHDAEVWWNPAIQTTLREEGLVEDFALSYAASFESVPEQVVYCEHGNKFDPANTIRDYEDPLDTPLVHLQTRW
jgi:UDP-2,3-diacylglucosamine pyrophosphatase LpxH